MKIIKKFFSNKDSDVNVDNLENVYNIISESDSKALESNDLTIIYFYDTNCKACHKANTILNYLILKFINVKFVKISLEHDYNLKFFKKYNIKATPSYVIKKNNKIIKDPSILQSFEDVNLQLNCILSE